MAARHRRPDRSLLSRLLHLVQPGSRPRDERSNVMTAGTDFGAPPPVSSTSYIGVPGGYGYLPRQNRGGFNVFGALGAPTFGDQSGSVNGAPVAPKYQTGDEFSVAS